MHYLGSNETINWLFLLACLSIIQWIITLIYVSKNYSILGREITNNAFNIKSKYNVIDYKKKVSFTKDYFYIYWNIYPIIFYGFFYYLDTSWSSYLNQIIMIGGEEAREVYNSWFKIFDFFGMKINYDYIDIIVLSIATLFAYMAIFGTQIKKQKQFIEETDKLYWWDIRISKEIYWTRFIFLFFNMILVAFIAYLGLKVVLFITFILSIDSLTINPFHPDTFGGLKVLMEISSVILAIYLLRAMMGIVGFLDHRGVNDKFQFIGDVYHTSYFFFGISFIIFFIYKIDTILGSIDISKLLGHEMYKAYNICADLNITTMKNIICQESNRTQIAQLGGDISNYYTNLLQFNKFPIDLALFSSSIFTFIFPLSLWFIISFIENRTKEIEKESECSDE